MPNVLLADRFSAAPMVDVTTSLFRQLCRLMTKQAMLYTEMIAADAIVHGKHHLIAFDEVELPLTLQLGGNDPTKMAQAAKVGAALGYSAININAGCPSDKVQRGAFGAILMKDIPLLCEIFQAMQGAVDIPVSIKTRIGVDEDDSWDFTLHLVQSLVDAGVKHLILHARKAWLNGLSPLQNRTIPPLDYDRVYRLKKMFPQIFFTINGGITTLEQCQGHLTQVDGVMLGRAIIDNPYLLTCVDSAILGYATPVLSRAACMEQFIAQAALLRSRGVALHHFARHLLGFFSGIRGARAYRRYLSEHMTDLGADERVLAAAFALIDKDALEGKESA